MAKNTKELSKSNGLPTFDQKQKGNDMNNNSSNISKNFGTSLRLFKGTKNGIGDLIANDDVTSIANWLVYSGPMAKEVYVMSAEDRNGSIPQMRAALRGTLRMWDRIANGDFDSWSVGNHYVLKSFEVNPILGTVAPQSGLTGIDHLVKDKITGKWLLAGIVVSDINGERAKYHEEVDYFLSGLYHVAVYVPSVIGNGWIRSVVKNLQSGTGKVMMAVEEAIETATAEHDLYVLNRQLVETGNPQGKAPEPVAPKLLVKVEQGGTLDMYQQKVGSAFIVVVGGTTPFAEPFVWDPDDEGIVSYFETISNQKTTSVRPVS
jgi:hypothetical protein